MTEKIERRGIRTPNAYAPDVLQSMNALDIMDTAPTLICNDNKPGDVEQWLLDNTNTCQNNLLIVTDKDENFIGYVDTANLLGEHVNDTSSVSTMLSKKFPVAYAQQSLGVIAKMMGAHNMQSIAILEGKRNRKVAGVISSNQILQAYNNYHKKENNYQVSISVKRRTRKLLVRGRTFVHSKFSKDEEE